MLQTMLPFLQAAPALQGIALGIEQAGPQPYTGGLWLRGVSVKARRRDLLGGETLTCCARLLLRLCLPFPDADNACRLEELQSYLETESAGGRTPRFGNSGEPETLFAGEARLERADGDGTACYTVCLTAEYTDYHTEDTP